MLNHNCELLQIGDPLCATCIVDLALFLESERLMIIAQSLFNQKLVSSPLDTYDAAAHRPHNHKLNNSEQQLKKAWTKMQRDFNVASK